MDQGKNSVLWMNSVSCFLSYISFSLYSFLFFSLFLVPDCRMSWFLQKPASWAVWCNPHGWAPLGTWMKRSWMAQMMLWAPSSPEGPWSSLPSTVTLGVWEQCMVPMPAGAMASTSATMTRAGNWGGLRSWALKKVCGTTFISIFLSPHMSFSDLQWWNSALSALCA